MHKFIAKVLGLLAQADTPINFELNDRNPTISVSTKNMDLWMLGLHKSKAGTEDKKPE